MVKIGNIISILVTVAVVIALVIYLVNQYKTAFKTIVKSNVWPPSVNKCPDYWVLGENKTCQNVKKLGKCGEEDGAGCCEFKTEDFDKMKESQRCAWAKDCSVTWDGVCN